MSSNSTQSQPAAANNSTSASHPYPVTDRELSSVLSLFSPLPSIFLPAVDRLASLDIEFTAANAKFDEAHENYLQKLKDKRLSEPEMLVEEAKLDEFHHALLSLAKRKHAVAMDSYEIIDSNVRKLDSQLRKYEAKLRKTQFSLEVPAAPVDRRRGAKRGLIVDSAAREIHYRAVEELKIDIEKSTGWNNEENRTEGGQAANQTGEAKFSDSNHLTTESSEPLYCLCRKISYGAMVACDNEDCDVVWFHFSCVGLETKPRGKWYCSSCSKLKKFKNHKKQKTGKFDEENEEENE